MADEMKPSAKDEQAPDIAGAPIEDLPHKEAATDDVDQVKGGKKLSWDIPAGTASPSA